MLQSWNLPAWHEAFRSALELDAGLHRGGPENRVDRTLHIFDEGRVQALELKGKPFVVGPLRRTFWGAVCLLPSGKVSLSVVGREGSVDQNRVYGRKMSS